MPRLRYYSQGLVGRSPHENARPVSRPGAKRFSPIFGADSLDETGGVFERPSLSAQRRKWESILQFQGLAGWPFGVPAAAKCGRDVVVALPVGALFPGSVCRSRIVDLEQVPG